MSYQYRESKKATPEDIIIKLFKTNEKKKTLKQQEKIDILNVRKTNKNYYKCLRLNSRKQENNEQKSIKDKMGEQ